MVDGGGEEAEEGGATAAHGGIDGAQVEETVADGGDLRMEGEDVGLEVVDEATLPLLYGKGEDVAEGLCGLAWCDAGIGLARGDMDVGLHHDEYPAGEADADGRETVADAGGEHGAVLDEEGTVGTQGGHELTHLRGAHAELELFVEQTHHEGGVAAAATKSCTGWYVLEKTYVKRWQLKLLFNLLQGAIDEVLFHVAVEGVAGLVEAAVGV